MPTYDYAHSGAYFVTLCTHNRECVLHIPPIADIILDVWTSLPARFPTIALDEFVVMPNHVHFVIWLLTHLDMQDEYDGQGQRQEDGQGQALPLPPMKHDWIVPMPTKTNPIPSLGDVVAAFKSLVFTVFLDWIETHHEDSQARFWQRNYYEHVVRNERELRAIRQYIRDNPAHWEMDRDNLQGHSGQAVPVQIGDYLSDLASITERP